MRETAVSCAALLVVITSLGVAGCSERTLLRIDVTGDRTFEDVTLRLSASRPGTPPASRDADFPGARFGTDDAFKAGLYLPAGWSGALTVSAKVIDGACEVAAGSASVTGVQAEETSAVITIRVVSHPACIPVGDGGAGGSGGGGGGAGAGGASGGASGAGRGGGGAGGTGGAAGSGSGAAGTTGGGGGAGGLAGVGGVAGAAGAGGFSGAGGRGGTGGGAGAGGRGGGAGIGASGGRGGIGGTAGAGGIAGAGGTFGGSGGAVGGTGGAIGGAGGVSGRGGAGGAGGCSPNPNPCMGRNCGSAQDGCGQTVSCGLCRADECCDLGVCGPAGNPPRC